METKITAESLLRCYQRAVDLGDRLSDGSHHHKGLTVSVEPDGYSVGVSDGTVTARVLFHNKVSITGGNRKSLARFRKLLEMAAA